MRLLVAPVMFMVCLFLVGCAGDEGPAGPTGPAGPSGTVDCFGCHSDTTSVITAAESQWDHSMHASVPHLYYGARSGCSDCHSGIGFIEHIEYDTVYTAEDMATPIGCFTCHAPHTNGDFGLRIKAAYTLMDGETFDGGGGNLCANCHHSRRDVNEYVTDPTVISSHFGPHHSNQADMLAGTGGYEFAGESYGSSPHYNVISDGCLDCHMTPLIGNQVGGHSWNMIGYTDRYNLGGCNESTCHNDEFEDTFDEREGTDYDGDTIVEGVQTEIEGLLEDLGGQLIALGYIDADGGGLGDTVAVDMAGAIYNYKFVKDDQSHGIHNTDYTVDLLQTSLDFLAKKKQADGSIGPISSR